MTFLPFSIQKALRISTGLAMATLIAFSDPSGASAACCKCRPAGDPKTNVCITTTQECGTMPTQSSNAQVKTLTSCTPIEDTQCKSIANNGICTGDPQEEFLYTSAPGLVSNSSTRSSTYTLIPPSLMIAIPGLAFSTQTIEKDGKVSIPFFAQYIAAAYQAFIGISAVAAAIMIAYGGFLYIFAETGASVRQGKTIITDAVIGLALMLGAYTVLNAVNPATLQLNSLNVQVITPDHPEIETLNPKAYAQTLASSPTIPQMPGQSSPGIPPPGGTGVIHDGSCNFEQNQAGLPTVLSLYKCAVDVIAKETGIDSCYLVIGINNESYLALPNSIGHDENVLIKRQDRSGEMTLFPERIRFLENKTTFKDRPITNPDHQLNDDVFDINKPDVGLDKRYSHGGGLLQFTVKSICGKSYSKLDVIRPYGGIRAGADHIKCNLGNQNALQTQQYPGTIAMIWTLWGGCYYQGRPGVCPPFNPTSTLIPPGGRTEQTYKCIQGGKPFEKINPSFFSICRGDLPLDREQCKSYIRDTIVPIVPSVNPETACNQICADSRMPVKCGRKDSVCQIR